MGELREATHQALSDSGLGLLDSSKRFVSYVTDLIDTESTDARVLYAGCDDPFLEFFSSAAKVGTVDALEGAIERAADRLHVEHVIDARLARRVSREIAQGVGDTVGVKVPDAVQAVQQTGSHMTPVNSVPNVAGGFASQMPQSSFTMPVTPAPPISEAPAMGPRHSSTRLTMPVGGPQGYVPPQQPVQVVAPVQTPSRPSKAPMIIAMLLGALAAVGIILGVMAITDSGSSTGESVQNQTDNSQNSDVGNQDDSEPEPEPDPEPEPEPDPEPEPEPEPEPVPATPPAPVFTVANASSTLPGDSITSYYGPNNAIDDNFLTAWNEGANGSGVGEWLSIEATSEQAVRGITIVTGYPKSEDIYYKNNRVKDITIELSDGSRFTATLKDEYRSYQQIEFGDYYYTTYVRVYINSIYKGSKWDDCSICELSAF